jgi:hypothetical protein
MIKNLSKNWIYAGIGIIVAGIIIVVVFLMRSGDFGLRGSTSPYTGNVGEYQKQFADLDEFLQRADPVALEAYDMQRSEQSKADFFAEADVAEEVLLLEQESARPPLADPDEES